MSTLTWITGKELQREVNNNGDQFLWKKNMKIVYESCFFANKKQKCAARAKFFLLIRKKVCSTCKVCFLLIRSIVVVFYRFRCFHPVFNIIRLYIFFEETMSIKESLAFSRG